MNRSLLSSCFYVERLFCHPRLDSSSYKRFELGYANRWGTYVENPADFSSTPFRSIAPHFCQLGGRLSLCNTCITFHLLPRRVGAHPPFGHLLTKSCCRGLCLTMMLAALSFNAAVVGLSIVQSSGFIAHPSLGQPKVSSRASAAGGDVVGESPPAVPCLEFYSGIGGLRVSLESAVNFATCVKSFEISSLANSVSPI